MDVSKHHCGVLSADAQAYQQQCQTPCMLTRSGTVRAKRVLVPPPPRSLIPRYVMALCQRLFPGVAYPVDLGTVAVPLTATPQQVCLLRRYGLVKGYHGRLGKYASPCEREARIAQHRRRERQYYRQWLERRRQRDKQCNP